MSNPFGMVDAHAHLFMGERSLQDQIENADQAGVRGIVNVATNVTDLADILQNVVDARSFADGRVSVFPTIGVHPCDLTDDWRLTIDAVARALADPSAFIAAFGLNPSDFRDQPFVAIGEVGMDFYRPNNVGRSVQEAALRAQLVLAEAHDLPVIIHSRVADEALLPVCESFPNVRKVFHCFSSDVDVMRRVIAHNGWVSFTGMITIGRLAFIDNVIREVPRDRIMVETDRPFLTPARYKGQENQSAFVPEVVAHIAQLWNVSPDEVAAQTTRTATDFFRLVR